MYLHHDTYSALNLFVPYFGGLQPTRETGAIWVLGIYAQLLPSLKLT